MSASPFMSVRNLLERHHAHVHDSGWRGRPEKPTKQNDVVVVSSSRITVNSRSKVKASVTSYSYRYCSYKAS